MRRIIRLALAGLLVLAGLLTAGSAVAATAQAAEGPYYTVESVRLGAKVPVPTLGKATKAFVLTAGAIKVTCETLTIEKATIFGSAGTNGSTGEQSLTFANCLVVGNGEKCEVEGKKLTTNQLKTTLAFANKESKAGETLLVHYAPVAGAIATLKFVGACTTKETVLEGSFDGEAWSGGKAVKLGEEPLDKVSNEANFPTAAIKAAFIEEEKVRKEVKPALFAFGKAAVLEGRSSSTLASLETWGVAAGLPPAPQIERVDFLNTEKVTVDHRKEANHAELQKLRKEGFGAPEQPIELSEYGAKDEIEWKSPKIANPTDWPLAFPWLSIVKLKAYFALEAGTREFLEKRLEGEPKFIGETAIGGVAITFEATVANVAEQLEKHNTYLEAEMKASAALPEKIKYEAVTVAWRWTAKEKGRAGAIEQKAGKSTHNIYITAAAAKGTVYLTLLDLDTQSVEPEPQPPTAAQILNGTWKGFSSVEAGVPAVHIRIYNPANGELKRTGAVLWYYEELPVKVNLKQYREKVPLACGIGVVKGLLEWAMGECGSWQGAFDSARNTEGAADTAVKVNVKAPKGPCAEEELCPFLVKEWKFEGEGTSGDKEFPYKETEVVDESGAVGQGVKNPASFFVNHQVNEDENKLYDPSYGTEPLGKGKEGPLGKGEEAKEIKLDYQEKAISGFCVFSVEANEYHCRKTPKGELWLNFQ